MVYLIQLMLMFKSMIKKQSEKMHQNKNELKKYDMQQDNNLISSSDDEDKDENEFLIANQGRLNTRQKSKGGKDFENTQEESAILNDTVSIKKGRIGNVLKT